MELLLEKILIIKIRQMAKPTACGIYSVLSDDRVGTFGPKFFIGTSLGKEITPQNKNEPE
jgi:hypothetical protein